MNKVSVTDQTFKTVHAVAIYKASVGVKARADLLRRSKRNLTSDHDASLADNGFEH
jgi:hypothetical protein